MFIAFTEEERQFQQEVKSVLSGEITPEMIEEHRTFRECLGPQARLLMRKLGTRRWLTPTWPEEYGGLGGTNVQRLVVYDELAARGVQHVYMGASIIGPTLMLFGSDEQKEKYLRRIASGELEFAVAYTEPQAGSDLASLDIRAVEDGDYFVINGQKTFNTGMHYSEYAWLAVRTSTQGPPHKGISLLIVDLKTQGITIRPMFTMDGERTNEVFYDDVRVPKQNLVGQLNRGFYHMMSALDAERLFPTGHIGRIYDQLLEFVKSTSRDGQPLAKDPLVRQRMAQLAIEYDIVRLLSFRTAWMLDSQKSPTHEAAMLKLFMTELMQRIGIVGLQLMRQYGQLLGGGTVAELGAEASAFYMAGIRRCITAGANEIQRNVIAVRGLGLAR